MFLKEFRNHFNKELSSIFPQTEIDSFFYLLMEKKLGLQRIDLALNHAISLSNDNFQYLYNALARLKAQEPIQYILGETEFFGLPFKVTKDTLIPRPETEELVSWILSEFNSNNQNLTILDIGTGSGCIAISLAKNLPNAKISAIDISSKAIHIAKQNAARNNVHIDFMELDILSKNQLHQKFDIIVSNPPYVREIEKQEMHANVLQNEPPIALFVSDEQPLLFYDKIADLAKEQLKKEGSLFFEINQYLGNETIKMLNEKGFKTELRKDIFGNDRMTKSSR